MVSLELSRPLRGDILPKPTASYWRGSTGGITEKLKGAGPLAQYRHVSKCAMLIIDIVTVSYYSLFIFGHDLFCRNPTVLSLEVTRCEGREWDKEITFLGSRRRRKMISSRIFYLKMGYFLDTVFRGGLKCFFLRTINTYNLLHA